MYLNIKMWFAAKKPACAVTTLKSLIRNMITGVTDVSSTLFFAFVLSKIVKSIFLFPFKLINYN